MFDAFVKFARQLFHTEEFIALHEPCFCGSEKDLVVECIDSTFVSSVGKFVDKFEEMVAEYTGAKYAVAVVNGTQALFTALKLIGADRDVEVITQSLTFVATANAIASTGASPVFIDVDRDTMGMSSASLSEFLESNVTKTDHACINRHTRKKVLACVPMHTLGHPCRIDEIVEICKGYGIVVIEDAAESLGSHYQGRHTGLFGRLGVLSFNGNKIITTGGGGMIITEDEDLARRAKHLTTTAKIPHPWEFNHDEIGFNFRMPNLNAALGVAQMEQLPSFLASKRELANEYRSFFAKLGVQCVGEPANAVSNYWLNAIQLEDRKQRDSFLEYTNQLGVMTRCLWTPMHQLPMYQKSQTAPLTNTGLLFDRIVNLPSSVRQ